VIERDQRRILYTMEQTRLGIKYTRQDGDVKEKGEFVLVIVIAKSHGGVECM